MTGPLRRRYFGTDGVRGKVGEYPINAEFVLKLGWAAGRVLSHTHSARNKVLIGKDTRISGYMFESALQAGLSAAGVDVRLSGPMPTPAIAYLTRTLHCQAGIVISASHNPYYDNGIKFFSSQGAKLAREIELAIEEELVKPMETVDSAELGKAERVSDAGGRYIEFCKSTVPAMEFRGMRILVDCAHGATYHVAPNVFEELGMDVCTLGTEPDGLNINEQCGSTQPDALQTAVLQQQADLGIALDGDGDRVIMVDHRGEVVDGDELLFIIAESRMRTQCLQGAVVGTLMSNFGLEQALQIRGIDFVRTEVGDRYVLEKLREGGGILGGESSGHIICLDRTTTGDGIVAALQVVAEINRSGRTLNELKQGMIKLPQCMVNVKVTANFDIYKSEHVQNIYHAVTAELGQSGRVLLRASGTEPVIRVMVEGADAKQVNTLAHQLAEAVSAAVAAQL